MNWPIQPKPSKVSFATWRRYIKWCFINPSNSQIPALGMWDLDSVTSQSPRRWYFSPSHQSVYLSILSAPYHSYPASFTQREQIAIPLHHVCQQRTSLPPDSVPTDLQKKQTHYIIDLKTTPRYRKPIPIPPELPKCQATILRHAEIYDTQRFQDTCNTANAEIMIMSNGGVHNYQGNFGLVIAHKGVHLAVNYDKLYSIEFYESSYHSELYGVLSGLVTFHHFLNSLEIILPFLTKIKLLCDNKSVVNKIISRTELRRTVNQHCHPDVDIEMQVIHEISQLEAKSCIISIQHVRGHQDTKNQKTFLSMEEQLNITADKLTHRARAIPDQK
jgi:hypothetical protein